MEEIFITINPDGNVTIRTKGFKGKSCLKATEALEEALGKVSERKLTSEYYEQEATHNATQKH